MCLHYTPTSPSLLTSSFQQELLRSLQPPPCQVTLFELGVHDGFTEDVDQQTQGTHSCLDVDVALEEEHQPVEAEDLVELVDGPTQEKKSLTRTAQPQPTASYPSLSSISSLPSPPLPSHSLHTHTGVGRTHHGQYQVKEHVSLPSPPLPSPQSLPSPPLPSHSLHIHTGVSRTHHGQYQVKEHVPQTHRLHHVVSVTSIDTPGPRQLRVLTLMLLLTLLLLLLLFCAFSARQHV